MVKRVLLDVVMAVALVSEFCYPFTGSTAHELIGIALLCLGAWHVCWNGRWFLALAKGHYSGLRLASTLVNGGLFVTALLTLLSGVLNSNLLYRLTGVEFDLISREVHAAAGYWFLILMAVHIGMHGKQLMTLLGNAARVGAPSPRRTFALRVVALAVVVGGIRASFARNMLEKLSAYYAFDFLDPGESLSDFLVQYLAIVGLYACLAFYAREMLKSCAAALKPARRNPLSPRQH